MTRIVKSVLFSYGKSEDIAGKPAILRAKRVFSLGRSRTRPVPKASFGRGRARCKAGREASLSSVHFAAESEGCVTAR